MGISPQPYVENRYVIDSKSQLGSVKQLISQNPIFQDA